MRLAIDVMGGDHAPDAILRGCVDALAHLSPDERLVLVGPRDVIEDYLRERAVRDARIEIEHAPSVIEMHEPPVEAVRQKRDSSIVRMTTLASSKVDRPVDAVISAGNTGACVSAATMHMRRLPHVHRPGIAVTIPGFGGPVVLCDAGANPEPRPSHLVQYAVMAEVYSSQVLGVKSPRVAQLNIGAEEAKGTDLIKEVRDRLRATAGLNYVGYVEGRDIMEGAADVIVTDGFVGNTVLKLAEGMAKAVFKAIAHEILAHDPELALRFEPVAKIIAKKHDYHEYGGAPLLGVNGVCVICHGSSEPRAITAAVRQARQFVRAGVNEAIVDRLARIETAAEDASPHVKSPARQAVRRSA